MNSSITFIRHAVVFVFPYFFIGIKNRKFIINLNARGSTIRDLSVLSASQYVPSQCVPILTLLSSLYHMILHYSNYTFNCFIILFISFNCFIILFISFNCSIFCLYFQLFHHLSFNCSIILFLLKFIKIIIYIFDENVLYLLKLCGKSVSVNIK